MADRKLNKENHYEYEPRPAVRQRDWGLIHHSPLFWGGVFLFLAAIMIYVLSDNLSWWPRFH